MAEHGARTRRCIGWGEREGVCENAATANEARLWCPGCERQRVADLSEQFAAITASFDDKGSRPDA